MCERIKPRNDEKRVPNSLICRAITFILAVAFLFPFSSSLATGAGANDLTLTDNVTINLDNRIEMHNIFFSPDAINRLSANPGTTTTVSKHAETPRTSGKLMIAGGLGKRILTVSAEVYDADTRSWLAEGNFAIGRGRGFPTIPFSSRVLVWAGIIVPF